MSNATEVYTRKWAQSQITSPNAQLKAQWMLRFIKSLGVRHVLDAGCGAGVLVGKLDSAGIDATGLDYSEANLSVAVLENPARYKLGDIEDMPFPNSSFDCVVMSHVLEHISLPRYAVLSALRVLSPGGYLVIAVPNRLSVNNRLGSQQAGWLVYDATHVQAFSPAELSNIVSGCGFIITRCWAHTYAPDAVLMLLSALFRRATKGTLTCSSESVRQTSTQWSHSWLGKVGGWLPARLSELGNRGNEIILVARKRN